VEGAGGGRGPAPAVARATGRPRILTALVPAVVVLAVDQLTKIWAVEALADGPTTIVGDVELRLSRNSGSAFSLFQGQTVFLALLAAVMAVVLVRLVGRATSRLTAGALALILGGALGNLTDRIFRAPSFLRGHVVDFISFPHWPSFNVADSAITVGAVLVVLSGWRRQPERARGQSADGPPSGPVRDAEANRSIES
jgi:signal peptidase II